MKHRRNRNNRRSSRGQGNRSVKIAALCLLPILVIGGVLGALIIVEPGEQMSSNFCYPSSSQYQAAYFVDSSFTHQTSKQQNLDLERSLGKAYERLPPNGMLSVFTTTRDVHATVAQPKFSVCKPAETFEEHAAVTTASLTAQQVRYASEKAREFFASKVVAVIHEGKDLSLTAHNSPIIETVRGISRYYELGSLNRFEIYTDGIVNSPVGSWCVVQGDFPPFSVFSNRPDYDQLRPQPLNGVDVNIWLVEWPGLPGQYCTRQELRAFWPAFFTGQNARNVQIDYLAYGG